VAARPAQRSAARSSAKSGSNQRPSFDGLSLGRFFKQGENMGKCIKRGAVLTELRCSGCGHVKPLIAYNDGQRTCRECKSDADKARNKARRERLQAALNRSRELVEQARRISRD
jgi:hypothetical protein